METVVAYTFHLNIQYNFMLKTPDSRTKSEFLATQCYWQATSLSVLCVGYVLRGAPVTSVILMYHIHIYEVVCYILKMLCLPV